MQDITRKHWIDLTKALCMLGVYLKHSQVYSGSSDYGFFVNPFYVNAFFFLNGYLFFRRTQEMTKPAILTYFNMGGKIPYKSTIPAHNPNHLVCYTHLCAQDTIPRWRCIVARLLLQCVGWY